MIHHLDIHGFLEAENKFDKKLQKAIVEGNELDRNLIMHIGAVSAIICFILQLVAIFCFTVFYDQSSTILCSVVFLACFQGVKYGLGGFGGNGSILNTIKLLLGLLSIGFFGSLPTLQPELAFDWYNGNLLSKIEVWAFMLLGGLLLGISLATYVKSNVSERGLVYNRFVAGFNAGIAIAVSILILLCSYR